MVARDFRGRPGRRAPGTVENLFVTGGETGLSLRLSGETSVSTSVRGETWANFGSSLGTGAGLGATDLETC